jgi:hypothetical protein
MEQNLTQILKNRQKDRQKILNLPEDEAKKYIKLIKILILTDEQIIDAMIATYFEYHTGITPIKTPHRLPKKFISKFKDDQEFFYYLTDLLKERIK